MVDNSQGHSAYSEDALLTTRMNVNPGGKLLHYCRNIRLTWVLFYSSDTKKFVEFEWLVLRPMGS
jgi:hypothetical protein